MATTTFVYLHKLRGFYDQLVPLRRVNFLVGENSTGKTSFMQLLSMFTNPAFWVFEPSFDATDLAKRHFLDLVSASIVNKLEKSTFTIGTISIADDGPATADHGMFVTYVNEDGRPEPTRVTVVSEGKARTVDGRIWDQNEGDTYAYRVREVGSLWAQLPSASRASRYAAAHRTASSRTMPTKTVSAEQAHMPFFVRFGEVLRDGKSFGEGIAVPKLFRRHMVTLAPIRTKPRRTYDEPQTEFSGEGDHTPYLIKRQLSNKTKAEAFSAFMRKVGTATGLFTDVIVKNYGRAARAPFEVQVQLGKTPLSLEQVGYGVPQALPLIVEMFSRPQDSAFLIQQPEVHLHPKAQAAIGDLVAELSRADKKAFVIETHSDFAIDRFRMNVRENGPISSQLLFFQRIKGTNKAIPIPIAEDGSLPEDQPAAYRDFFLNESLALL